VPCPPGSLTPLQRRALCALAGMTPEWTLTGGAALAGAWLGHRTTRDLDLFFHGLSELADAPQRVRDALRAAGIAADAVRTEPSFAELRIHDADQVVIIDLVAEPVPNVDAVRTVELDGAVMRVDSPHEILVNELCALLGRSELRDLVDVDALLGAGESLERAVGDAPKKDGGFSPLTLAWVLKGFPLARLAASGGSDHASAEHLEEIRSSLVHRLLAITAPATDPDDA